MRSNRFSFVPLLLFVLAGGTALGQEGRGSESRFQQQAPVFTETRNFISSTPGKSRLDVNVHIPYTFLVFIRNNSPTAALPFVANADVVIDILDSAQHAAAHRALRREVDAETPPEPGSSPRFVSVLASFEVPPGQYTVATEVDDVESMRRTVDEGKSVVARDWESKPLLLSDVLFFEHLPSDSLPRVAPFQMGGDVPFGGNFFAYSEITSSVRIDSLKLIRTLYGMNPETHARALMFRDTLTEPARARMLTVRQSDQEEYYSLSDSTTPGKTAAWMPFRGDTLKEGSYELELTASAGSEQASATRPFRIRWFDMPRSLRSLPFAIDALEYIASEHELKEMKSARGERQRELFEAFWKKRDKTPATVYNEMMAEYYTRVDHAATAFSTIHQQNGVKTDRGKAYILYGPPAKTERQLTPGSEPTETWYYPTLHKKIVFIDRSRVGDYTLVSAESY